MESLAFVMKYASVRDIVWMGLTYPEKPSSGSHSLILELTSFQTAEDLEGEGVFVHYPLDKDILFPFT
jgi:hypothetical protein